MVDLRTGHEALSWAGAALRGIGSFKGLTPQEVSRDLATAAENFPEKREYALAAGIVRARIAERAGIVRHVYSSLAES